MALFVTVLSLQGHRRLSFCSPSSPGKVLCIPLVPQIPNPPAAPRLLWLMASRCLPAWHPPNISQTGDPDHDVGKKCLAATRLGCCPHLQPTMGLSGATSSISSWQPLGPPVCPCTALGQSPCGAQGGEHQLMCSMISPYWRASCIPAQTLLTGGYSPSYIPPRNPP